MYDHVSKYIDEVEILHRIDKAIATLNLSEIGNAFCVWLTSSLILRLTGF